MASARLLFSFGSEPSAAGSRRASARQRNSVIWPRRLQPAQLLAASDAGSSARNIFGSPISARLHLSFSWIASGVEAAALLSQPSPSSPARRQRRNLLLCPLPGLNRHAQFSLSPARPRLLDVVGNPGRLSTASCNLGIGEGSLSIPCLLPDTQSRSGKL